jgi:hypothetical protein
MRAFPQKPFALVGGWFRIFCAVRRTAPTGELDVHSLNLQFLCAKGRFCKEGERKNYQGDSRAHTGGGVLAP